MSELDTTIADCGERNATIHQDSLVGAGVDTVIFSLRNPYDPAIIEPLGKALEHVSCPDRPAPNPGDRR